MNESFKVEFASLLLKSLLTIRWSSDFKVAESLPLALIFTEGKMILK